MARPAPEWEFEPADPEVGFLSDTITHTCDANVEADTYDVKPAEVQDVTLRNVVRNCVTWVGEFTTLRCPACEATTTQVEHWPLWMFEEQPGGDE